MARTPFPSPVDRLALARLLRRWRKVVRSGDSAALTALQEPAAALQPCLDAVTARMREGRLGLPRPDQPPDDLPPRTDWIWRPAPWVTRMRPAGWAGVASGQALGDGVTVHHDCTVSTVSLRQTPEPGAWAVTLDWAGFDGTYLSLAIPLPDQALAGLSKDHVIGLSAERQSEVGGALYCRLNIRSGPNMDQASLQAGFGAGIDRTEFDLAYMRFDANRLDAAWIDVIFEAHPANRVALRDVVVTRHRRAAL